MRIPPAYGHSTSESSEVVICVFDGWVMNGFRYAHDPPRAFFPQANASSLRLRCAVSARPRLLPSEQMPPCCSNGELRSIAKFLLPGRRTSGVGIKLPAKIGLDALASTLEAVSPVCRGKAGGCVVRLAGRALLSLRWSRSEPFRAEFWLWTTFKFRLHQACGRYGLISQAKPLRGVASAQCRHAFHRNPTK